LQKPEKTRILQTLSTALAWAQQHGRKPAYTTEYKYVIIAYWLAVCDEKIALAMRRFCVILTMVHAVRSLSLSGRQPRKPTWTVIGL